MYKIIIIFSVYNSSNTFYSQSLLKWKMIGTSNCPIKSTPIPTFNIKAKPNQTSCFNPLPLRKSLTSFIKIINPQAPIKSQTSVQESSSSLMKTSWQKKSLSKKAMIWRMRLGSFVNISTKRLSNWENQRIMSVWSKILLHKPILGHPTWGKSSTRKKWNQDKIFNKNLKIHQKTLLTPKRKTW